VPKFCIGTDERYPDYSLEKPIGSEGPEDLFEFSDEDYEDYLRVRHAYARWQDRLSMRVEAQA